MRYLVGGFLAIAVIAFGVFFLRPPAGPDCLKLDPAADTYMRHCAPGQARYPLPSPRASSGDEDRRAGAEGVTCPRDAVVIEPGEDLASAVASGAPGTAFCIRPGIHRILRGLEPKAGQQFIGERGAILNGSKLLTGWSRTDRGWVVGGQTLEVPPETGPQCEARPVACYYEDAFFDDRPLERVLELADLGPGRFYLDYANDQIHIADDPTGHELETSAAQAAFAGAEPNVVVRGLIIEKFTETGIQTGPTWLVEGNEIRWNHRAGVRQSTGTQLKNNYIHRNGQMGIAGQGSGLLVEGNEIAYNNYLGFGTLTGGPWSAGATKWLTTTGLVIRNNWSHHNYGDGFWTDFDNIEALYENNLVEDNARYGIFHEISGSVQIRNNTIRNNGDAGVFVNSSFDVEAYDNRILDNGNGVVLVSYPRGDYVLENAHIHDNIIRMATGYSGVKGAPEAFSDASNNRFESNDYIVPRPSNRYWQWNRELMTISEWRANGHDGFGAVAALAK